MCMYIYIYRYHIQKLSILLSFATWSRGIKVTKYSWPLNAAMAENYQAPDLIDGCIGCILEVTPLFCIQ